MSAKGGQAIAEQHGQSVNGFINSLIDEALARDQTHAGGGFGFPAFNPKDICNSQLTTPTSQNLNTSSEEPSIAAISKRLSAMSPEETEMIIMETSEQQEELQQEKTHKKEI